MIVGLYTTDTSDPLLERLEKATAPLSGVQAECGPGYALYWAPEKGGQYAHTHAGVVRVPGANAILLLQGHLFDLPWKDSGQTGALAAIADRFREGGSEGLKDWNGHFAGAYLDLDGSRLLLFRDHFGVEPLYYYQRGTALLFSSDPLFLLHSGLVPKELDPKGLHTYFLFNYVPLSETIVRGLKKVEPAHVLEFDGDSIRTGRYWKLSFRWDEGRSEEETARQLVLELKDAIRVRTDNGALQPGAFLSGGMDSSTVVGLASEYLDRPLATFSFRCRGESFDESRYAEIVSKAYGTQHHLVEFPPDKSLSITKLVELMPEPFSDIGIEVASFILGEYAGGKVQYILSGDGGDELFAGHPVYIADRVALRIDKVPGFIKAPIFGFFNLFPDSDKKKSFTVKAKRFAYSARFSPALHSNRWRIYYTREELQRALTPDAWQMVEGTDPLSDVEAIYREVDAPDFLSRSLYGDYATVVKFYLTRMNVLRHFGIEPRFPMFDRRLAEFAATIPSKLKIRASEDTKYILKKAMDGILPDEIVYRKDKLGHSVPMKNWMRDAEVVHRFLREVLSEENLRRRGLFRPDFVATLFEEHMSKKFNHSHRLWAMAVLELWLQKHFDA